MKIAILILFLSLAGCVSTEKQEVGFCPLPVRADDCTKAWLKKNVPEDVNTWIMAHNPPPYVLIWLKAQKEPPQCVKNYFRDIGAQQADIELYCGK